MIGVDETEVALELHGAGATDIGLRDHNEDTVLVRPDLRLYILADGAGGENAGNVASALATTSVAHHFEDSQATATGQPPFDDLGLPTGARRLSSAIHRANRDILEIARTSHRMRGMGTTVVAAFFEPEHGFVHIGHVGDSRCYRLRDGRFELVTQDHSLVNDVLELRPDIPDHQAARLPRHVVTRALGMSDGVRVSIKTLAIHPGDLFLLCSDGLTDTLDEHEIVETLENAKTATEQAQHLVERARAARASDNIAAIVVSCGLRRGATPFSSRPPAMRRRKALSGSTDPDLSSPEIIIVDEEPMAAGASSPHIHVVPMDSSSPDLMSALHGFVDSWHSASTPPPADEVLHCAKCGSAFPAVAGECPHC